MTWQDSLRQLDARLANGEIGASEYRRARDEILAEASSGSVPQASEDLWTPGRGNGVAERDQPASGETTIVVSVDTNEDEQTQIVSSDTINQQPAAASPQPSPPPRQPGPPPQGIPFPPQHRVAPLQGHEVFGETTPKRGGMLLRVLIPVVIVALIGAGIWWVFLRADDEPAPNASSGPPSSAEQKTPTADELADLLPDLPGKANANNGTLTLVRASELSLFTPAYATLLADHRANELAYRGAVRTGFAYMVVAAPVPADKGADNLVTATNERLSSVGFLPVEGLSPANPQAISRTDQTFRTYIAIYQSGDVWVQLNISAPPGGDENALKTEFENVLGTLTERLPAD